MDGLDITVVSAPEPPVVDEILALLDRSHRATGHAAISEHKRMELLRGRDALDPATTAPPDRLIAGVLARLREAADLIGYAHVGGDPATRDYAMELTVDPGADDAPAIADALLGASVEQVMALGGGNLRLWRSKASAADDALASVHGFHLERNLLQMRCPLPLPGPVAGSAPAAPIATRPFRPGGDEEAWLATNNRAFASHPEQGHWDLATLLEHEREPWFDPEGFLLLEEGGRLVGSCWTKIHASTDPPLGEIYVIGVDPEFHGRGWGRALTRAGLDWLAGRGLQVGMLYVDADNRAAVSMYRSMGFAEDHVDRAYLTTIDPA
jgi:mycothiol synthase